MVETEASASNAFGIGEGFNWHHKIMFERNSQFEQEQTVASVVNRANRDVSKRSSAELKGLSFLLF